MVLVEVEGSLMDSGDGNIAFTKTSDKDFHQQSSTVCLSGQQSLHLFNDIPKYRQIKAAAAKRDAGQNTDPILPTTNTSNKVKCFAAMLCLLGVIFGSFFVVEIISKTDTSKNTTTDAGSHNGGLNSLFKDVRESLGFANRNVHAVETCKSEKIQKITPAYPMLIRKDGAQKPKMNISRMLEDKGLRQWSSIVVRARADNEYRQPLYSYQCKSKGTATTKEGEKLHTESSSYFKSSLVILHGIDTMGTCKTDNSALSYQSWECRLLVALEELKQDLQTLPLKAFDKLIQIEYDKLKAKPHTISDLLKLIKVYFELESDITSGKALQSSNGACGITNVFNNIYSFKRHCESLLLWKTRRVQTLKIPLFQDSSFSRRLITEDVRFEERYYDEDPVHKTRMKDLTHIIMIADGFGSYSSPQFLSVNDIAEDSYDEAGPVSNFTHDFTSLGLQGDSSQRPAKKSLTGHSSCTQGDSNCGFWQGLMTLLSAATTWVVAAAVTSCYSLTDYCLLSTYVMIAAISMLVTSIMIMIRKIILAGYKLTSHIVIFMVLTLLYLILNVITQLPQVIYRQRMVQHMETVLLKLLKNSADKMHISLRIIHHLSLFAVLCGNPELSEDKQQTYHEKDSGLKELNSAESKDEETHRVVVRHREGKVKIKSETFTSLDNHDDCEGACGHAWNGACGGACGGLPMELINALRDADNTELTDRFELFELRKTVPRMRKGSNLSIDSIGYNQFCHENNNLREEIKVMEQDISNTVNDDLSCRLGMKEHDFHSSGTDQDHMNKGSVSWIKSEGSNFMKLEIGPTITRHLEESEILISESSADRRKGSIHSRATNHGNIDTESSVEDKEQIANAQIQAHLSGTLLHEGCKSEILLKSSVICREQSNAISAQPNQVNNPHIGEPTTFPNRESVVPAHKIAGQLLQQEYERLEATRLHDAAPSTAPVHYFPTYDGQVLTPVPAPTEYFDERLVVDILHPAKRKYQWQCKSYITGSFKDMMNFLLGIESAVHGSGMFLKWSSPLNIKDHILNYWIIRQYSDGQRNMCFDTRSDVVYFDEKIELRRFLEVRRRYEIYIDRQQNHIEKLKIFGITKSVEGGQHFVHVLYEYRKIVDNISVFITHSATCCGGRNTHKIFTVPRGSKVKEVLLLPEVEALKEKIMVEHPHLRNNMYVKLRICGVSWYPSPATRLNYNCMLQVIDSLT